MARLRGFVMETVRRRKTGNAVQYVVGASMAGAALGSILLLLSGSPVGPPPDFNRVRDSFRRSDAVVLDRHGEVIHEIRVNRERRRLEWAPLQEISPAMRRAAVFAEDRRFFEHHGVDWAAVLAAVRGLGSSSSLRGASTITMQLASKLDETLEPDRGRRSAWMKWRQMQAARSLERVWTKEQILEAYLNLVSFRGELQGIAAAARGLFGKSAHGLDECEAVILASLLRSPNAAIDPVVHRAHQLAESMGAQLTRDEIREHTTGALESRYIIPPQIALAPHVAQRLVQGRTRNDLQLQSTLDAGLQRLAAEALRHHLLSLRQRNVGDGAVLAVENKSGEILAYVGSAGELSSARHVDGIQSLRQAGSTLKPFLYGLAFESRLLTPASLIDDRPIDIPVVGGVYSPENYDHVFHGPVTARTALASSLNIPAVKVLGLVEVGPFLERLKGIGFRNLRSPDYYGPSLALGSADVTLWDLVNAYRTLAMGGLLTPMRLHRPGPAATVPARVFSEAASFLVSSILSDREGRSRTFSLESPLATRYWTAVKTGTSKDMRDNWCVGYSSEYTVGVWVGNFEGDPMWNVSGLTGAAPVWIEVMSRLHAGRSSRLPMPPRDVVAGLVRFKGSDQARREWFIQGTETSRIEEGTTGKIPRIVYPSARTIIALDPDIPAEDQKLFFESDPRSDRLSWILNGESLGRAGSILLWTPRPGKYTLELMSGTKAPLDSVQFEVRKTVTGNLIP